MTAIYREKEIKGWLRAKKIELIESANPAWDDLAADWFEPPPADGGMNGVSQEQLLRRFAPQDDNAGDAYPSTTSYPP